MRLVKVAVVGLLVVVLVVIVGGLGALVWVTGRAQPQGSGMVRVPGLQGEATVARDIAGIAHITAQTPADLFFAQGLRPRARIVITTGQAGNPFDRHYADQIDPWRNGETLPFPFSSEAVAAATVTTMTMTP